MASFSSGYTGTKSNSGSGGQRSSYTTSSPSPPGTIYGPVGGDPTIRRIEPPGSIVRIIEGHASNACNQQMPCPPPPCYFMPPPCPPGFCSPFLCPPPFPPPCFINNRLPNRLPNPNMKMPCSTPQPSSKDQNQKPQEQTPHFNNCNFYMSEPNQSTQPYMNPGIPNQNNPCVFPCTQITPPPSIPTSVPQEKPPPGVSKSITVPPKKRRSPPRKKKYDVPSESDGFSGVSDNCRKFPRSKNGDNYRTSNKRFEFSCPPTHRTSVHGTRNSKRCSEMNKEHCGRNTTIQILPEKDPTPCPTPVPPPPAEMAVPQPQPPQTCCSKSSKHPKLNPCCQKCVERYIEKQVALRLKKESVARAKREAALCSQLEAAIRSKKKCRCSTIQKTKCCLPPQPPPCQEEQVRIKIEPSMSLRDEGCCTDFPMTRSQATVTVQSQSARSMVSIMSEKATQSALRVGNNTLVVVESNQTIKPTRNCPLNQESQISLIFEPKAISPCNNNTCPDMQNSQVSIVIDDDIKPKCEMKTPCDPTSGESQSHITVAVASKATTHVGCPSNDSIAVAVLDPNPPSCVKRPCECCTKPHAQISIAVQSKPVQEPCVMNRSCQSNPKTETHISVAVQSNPTPSAVKRTCQSRPPTVVNSTMSITSTASVSASQFSVSVSNTTADACSEEETVCHGPTAPAQAHCAAVGTSNVIVAHRTTFVNAAAATSNAVTVRNQVDMQPICPQPLPRCPSQHLVVETQNICPVPQDIRRAPKARKHRVVKPSYSKIKRMIVRKSSDDCARRQHITVVKEHVPHETIQNSEASCCPYETVQVPAQQYTTVRANMTSLQQTPHPGTITISNKIRSPVPQIAPQYFQGQQQHPITQIQQSPQSEIPHRQDHNFPIESHRLVRISNAPDDTELTDLSYVSNQQQHCKTNTPAVRREVTIALNDRRQEGPGFYITSTAKKLPVETTHLTLKQLAEGQALMNLANQIAQNPVQMLQFHQNYSNAHDTHPEQDIKRSIVHKGGRKRRLQ